MTSSIVFQMQIIWFLVTTYSAAAFEFNCPHSSQRRLRAIGVCQDESKYSCLLDIIKEAYIEMCNQTADYVVRGEKYVISGGRRSYPCSSNRYQPFKFWSNLQSQCYYKKSLCSENEQIIYNFTSTKDDNICQCNYTNGYGFVTKSRNPCYCIPSQEDCTCYKVKCLENTTLSADTCRSNNCNEEKFKTVDSTRLYTSSPNINQMTVTDVSIVNTLKAILLTITVITLVSKVAVIIVLLKDIYSEVVVSQPACVLHLKTTLITWNKAADKIDFKDKTIKLLLLKPAEKKNLPQLFIQRVNCCSVWFVKELSMYPKIPETVVECTVELVPLLNDVHTAVKESISFEGLQKVFENCFGEKKAMKYIRPPNNQVQICVRMDNCIRNVNAELPTDKYCKMSDESYILLVANKKFLHKELQPGMIAESLLNTDELEEYKCKEQRNLQVEFLISKIDRNKLFAGFLEITKKTFAFIYRRLQFSKSAYLKRDLIARNIVRNIHDLSDENEFDLNDFKQTFLEREVFTVEMFNQLENRADNAGKQMLDFVVKTILSGTKAMFTFVDTLYLNGEDSLAKSLISNTSHPELNLESGTTNAKKIQETTQEDILLQACFQAYFT